MIQERLLEYIVMVSPIYNFKMFIYLPLRTPSFLDTEKDRLKNQQNNTEGGQFHIHIL